MAAFGFRDAWPEIISAVTATKDIGITLGEYRVWENDVYRFAYNDGGEQISPGFGCIIKSGATDYSVTITSISGVTPCFGVVKHATALTATFFWAITRGRVEVEADIDTGIAIFDQLVLGPDGVFTRITGATGYKTPVIAQALAGTASAGSATAYVNCF